MSFEETPSSSSASASTSSPTHTSPTVANLGKRKANNDDDDNDEKDSFVDVFNRGAIEHVANAFVAQEWYWHHLQQHPMSPILHGCLLMLAVRVAVNKRVLSVYSCACRLQSAMSRVLRVSGYLAAPKENAIIRKYLSARHESLLNIYDKYRDKSINEFIAISDHELHTICKQTAREGQFEYRAAVEDRHKQSVYRAKRTVERYSITPAQSESEIDGLDDDKICIVCLEQRRQICAVPCGHISMCHACATPISDCPVCRTNMMFKVRFIVS